ncbi:MAG: oligosaccharide flippase family protein [Halieaceae bacterium]|nr:oligosaccharide flippase family protein [Halieaceae bacterium]
MYVLSMPVGLLTSILLARYLGPAAFGQYAFVLSLLALLALPVAGGLPQLLTREVARFSHDERWALYRGVVPAAHGWVLLMAALVLISFWLAGPVGGLLPQTGKWALLGIAGHCWASGYCWCHFRVSMPYATERLRVWVFPH